MHRWLAIGIPMVMILALVCSCESNPEAPATVLNDNSIPPRLVEDESVGEPVRDREDELAGPVVISWVGVDAAGANNLGTLALQVQNISNITLTASVDLICDAFIDKTATKQMTPVSHEIAAGENVQFSIPVDEFPIQVLTGAGTFRALVNLVFTDPSGSGEPITRNISTTQFFYRHAAGYETMGVFSINELVKNQNGMVVDRTTTDSAVIGRILDAEDTAIPVLSQDTKVVVIGEDEKNYGTIDGFSIEIESE